MKVINLGYKFFLTNQRIRGISLIKKNYINLSIKIVN